MADHKTINWEYPFPPKETATNPLQYLTSLAKARSGYYPTGDNGLWHGGVHFDQGTAGILDQSCVRCIADGEVIAYKVNETYPISEYADSIPLISRLPFSSGFVLVKHKLSPPQQNNVDSTANAQTPPTLVFYSLYMHLQDWAGYRASTELPRPEFWEASSYIVDTQNQGLNIRSAPDANASVLAVLAKGSRISVKHTEGDFCQLLSIISGTAEPELAPNSDGSLPGFVASSLLKAQREPGDKGNVVVLEQGFKIKAGDLIGYPGTYQNHDDAAQPLIHLEVFSCEDVPRFIAKSRAWASTFPESKKKLLKVYKDASRLITHRDDINATNPPRLGDAGSQVGIDLTIPQTLLDGLPASSKIKVNSTVEGSNDSQTTYWWRLNELFADPEGNPIDGWLAEQDLITTRHSPWEWPDFKCVEDTGSPVDKLAYTFNIRGILSTEEQHNYRTKISKVDGGPLLTLLRLYEIVDTDKDGILSSEEIRAALGRPWHAQVLGQLVTKYESEWFWNKSKWDELAPLLEEEPGQPNRIWESEKKRIEELSWWKELAGKHGISEDGKAWHFQPIWLATLFRLNVRELISSIQMQKMFPDSVEIKREEVRKLFNQYADRFEINTPERISQFFAQIKAEVGYALLGKEESLWYSVQALKSTFRRYFNTYPGEAEELGYKRISIGEYNGLPSAAKRSYSVQGPYAYSQLPQPDEIAKRVYCCSADAGGFTLTKGGCEEGLMYKGKGFIQLTWKSNYEAVENILKQKLPEESINIVANPDQLLETKLGLLSAMGFWWMKNLNSLAAASTESTDLITAVVNLHTNSYEKRRNFFVSIYRVFQT